MKIFVSDEAAEWYKDEMNLKAGDSIRFSGKVYGKDGFSMILNKIEPSKPKVVTVINGISYFIEQTDSWFFEDSDLYITLDSETNEPSYETKK